ncbi:hypothetical protein MMC06_005851 [Schaereria dolodes]|nr:hypothetical protein [Schaereria dolodes]
MAPRIPLTVPTTAALPGSLRLPSTNSSVAKALTRLSRPSLLSLTQEWLMRNRQSSCAPCLAGDESDEDDSIYPKAQSLDELREIYEGLEKQKGGKRAVVDRILAGDWRHGISLEQLAMADIQYLMDHPTSQRWTALKLSRVMTTSDGDSAQTAGMEMENLPRFHGTTFLKSLQKEISSLVKAHYYLTRPLSLPLALLRIYISDSPYSSQDSFSTRGSKATNDASKIIYVAFPDNTPSIYVSIAFIPSQSAVGDGKSLRKIILDALPRAFSRPRERYTLRSTSLSARSLSALISVRGAGRGNASSGGWSIFSEGTVEQSPLAASSSASRIEKQDEEDKENLTTSENPKNGTKRRGRPSGGAGLQHDVDDPIAKRRKLVAESRFGQSGLEDDGKGIERLDIRLEDSFFKDDVDDSENIETAISTSATAPHPRRGRLSTMSVLDQPTEGVEDDEDGLVRGWIPDVRLTFQGAHIFAGIRKLIEIGVVDGEKMPGWMTGEEGVSIGVVRDGRVRGNKGAGCL